MQKLLSGGGAISALSPSAATPASTANLADECCFSVSILYMVAAFNHHNISPVQHVIMLQRHYEEHVRREGSEGRFQSWLPPNQRIISDIKEHDLLTAHSIPLHQIDFTELKKQCASNQFLIFSLHNTHRNSRHGISLYSLPNTAWLMMDTGLSIEECKPLSEPDQWQFLIEQGGLIIDTSPRLQNYLNDRYPVDQILIEIRPYSVIL